MRLYGMYLKINWKTYDCQNKIYGNQAPLLGCQLLLARMRSYLGHRVSWKYKLVISFSEAISNWLEWWTEIKYLKILSSFSPLFLGLNYAGLLMGDDTKTSRSTGFRLLSCTMLVERKSKQTAIDDRPKLMSSPINNPA